MNIVELKQELDQCIFAKQFINKKAASILEVELFVYLHHPLSIPMELNVFHDSLHKVIIIKTGNPMPSLFKLFDSMGNLLILREVSDNEEIPVKELKKGLYHYKLIAGPNLQTGKLTF